MYVVLCNLPDCLPEMEPVQCGTLYEAQDVLEAELESSMEGACARDAPQAVMDHWQDMIHEVRQIAGDTDLPWGRIGPDGYVYSISIEYP